jgi:hypothetical protein
MTNAKHRPIAPPGKKTENISVVYPGTAYKQYKKDYISFYGNDIALFDEAKFIMLMRAGKTISVGKRNYIGVKREVVHAANQQ